MSDDQRKDNKEDFPMAGNGEDCNCAPGECCPADSATGAPARKGLKTIVFVVIILAAVAVAAYSIVGNNEASDDPVTAMSMNPALDFLTTLQVDYGKDILGGKEFVYLTLAGAGAAADENKRVKALVDGVAELIRKQGVKVATASAAPGDSIFGRAVDLFDVTKLPAVLAMKNDGNSVLLDENITENNLLKLYLSGCDPNACGPGCDPKDCKK
jgi:hypothetical protein